MHVRVNNGVRGHRNSYLEIIFAKSLRNLIQSSTVWMGWVYNIYLFFFFFNGLIFYNMPEIQEGR